MTNLLCAVKVWHDMKFGFGAGDNGNPALWLFDFPVYVYALCIVGGMCVAILVSALYFKKRGYDPYDITIYALVLIPCGVVGARLYVYIFPWEGRLLDWSTIWNIRDGGLGIYGGVIMGYVSAWVLSRVKKQDFRIVTDSILPGVMIAQSMGRWGNFANQEAYGNLITASYDALPHAQSGIFSRFNGYAVWIDHSWYAPISEGGSHGWYQATFFYESVCTLVGFLICVLVLTRSKRYRLGWCTAFYGIYYGIVRLIIEQMRTDSLYLYIGATQTNIKISQLVSVFTICLGVILLTQVYRKELHALYKRFFRSDYDEMRKSRWILLALSIVLFGTGVAMFVLSGMAEHGQAEFILGFFLTVAAAYSALGVWSLFDRLRLYCPKCGQCHVPSQQWQSDRERYFVAFVCYTTVTALLVGFGLFSLIKWGIVDGIANGIVLFVVCIATAAAFIVLKDVPLFRSLSQVAKTDDSTHSTSVHAVCECGNEYDVKLNKFLLFVFPPKVYRDYGVSHLKPYVDPIKEQKRQAKLAKAAAQTSSDADSDGGSDDSQQK